MYDELVKRLRSEAVYLPEKFSKNAELLDVLMKAADAIEELQADKAALNGTVTNLLEQIKDLGKPRWIPVTERLPDNEDEVVVAFKNSADGEWWYRIDNFVDGAFCYNVAFGRNITHWMPLPQPPKEDEA